MILPALLSMTVAPPCLVVEGDLIRVRDLAPALPSLAAAPGDAVVGYAPLPGARRVFYEAELRRILEKSGVAGTPPGSLCVERDLVALDPGQVRAALARSLSQERARIEVVEVSRQPVPRGELHFPLSGAGPVDAARPDTPIRWRGFVRYGGSRSVAVWVRARVLLPATRVIAAETLPAGSLVSAGQVRVEPCQAPPAKLSRALRLEDVIGQVVRRKVPAGAELTASLLERPKEVARGDAVTVEVVKDGLRLTADGVAESSGRRGDSIVVRNASSGKKFTAKVEGKGKVSR